VYGAVGGMITGRGNRRIRREPVPLSLWPPQIPHDLTWEWTFIAVMESRRLTSSCSCASLSIISWWCVMNRGRAPSIHSLNEREWSASRPGSLTPEEIAFGTNWTGVGAPESISTCREEKYFLSRLEIEPRFRSHPACHVSLHRLGFSGVTVGC
jgi:hypothetical protein